MNITKSNSSCPYCKKRFNTTLESLSVCEECGEISHEKCYQKYNNHNPDCLNDNLVHHKCHNSRYVNESFLFKKSKVLKQKYIDIVSLKRTNYKPSLFDYFRGIFFRIPYLSYHASLLYINTFLGYNMNKQFAKFLDAVAYGLNINSTIYGKEKLNNMGNIIYVSNHVSFHDALTVPRYIKTNCMASVCTKNMLVNVLEKYVKILFVSRGDKNKKENIIDQINNFVEKNKSILICPQGLLGSYDTISKFRTSAFRTKFPVQPIVLKYKQNVSSMSSFNMLFFDRVDVSINVMDLEYPLNNETPDEFAERIRIKMANECDLLLSNVESHDAVD